MTVGSLQLHAVYGGSSLCLWIIFYEVDTCSWCFLVMNASRYFWLINFTLCVFLAW